MLLGLGANVLAAVLADAAIAFYVLVYTLGLKRRSASNIVIGGAAGCFPVLVGWAAVTGGVGWPAVAALRRRVLLRRRISGPWRSMFRDDYAAPRGFRCCRVVAGPDVVARKIVVYSA